MVKIRPARGAPGRWEADIRFTWPEGGEYRKRVNAPVPSKSGALRWAQAREAALLAAGYEASRATPKTRRFVSLDNFWPRVLSDHYRANRKKASTINAAEVIYRLHLGPLLGSKPLGDIRAADIAALKGAMVDHSAKTANNVLSVLSRVLHAAVEWGELAAAPRIALLPMQRPTMEWYERADYRRLVDASKTVSTTHALVVLLAGSAGLRLGEISALAWADLDMVRRQINVQRAIWRGHEASPKGGRGRLVPMTAELHDTLVAHMTANRIERWAVAGQATHRVLYSRRVRGVLTSTCMRTYVETSQLRAGMKVDGAVHKLRHTFCSHLAAAGVPAKAIQELAGHADLSTTLRYMHLAPGDRDGAMGLLAGYYEKST